MDLAAVMDLVREAVGVAIKLASPLLNLSMIVGVVVAIFQAVTQIHEQSINFMLKLVVVVTVLLIEGGWMMEPLQDYTYQVFALIATY